MWAFFWLACAEPSPPVAATPVPAVTTDLGARVFAERCASCHGPEGRGDGPAAVGLTPPPTDLSKPRPPELRHPPSRVDVVRDGKPGTAMVGFATVLPPEELAAVSDHIHRLAHGP